MHTVTPMRSIPPVPVKEENMNNLFSDNFRKLKLEFVEKVTTM